MTFKVPTSKSGRLWLVGVLVLFFYSFTQVDLGLTLTRVSWWQAIQKFFQQIGYFQRPFSTGLYIAILVLLFAGYGLILRSRKQLWPLILLTAAILWLAFNAFSYDLFNYIFDAKIITFYHQNPYQHKALDFPSDPMLGFMHWTHRTFPYGPIWLLISLPISFLGFDKLLPTMILFKALAVASYLLACWLIWKLSADKKALAFFAFSPLVVVETLVSGHHDILMMTFALAGFYFLKSNKIWLAWLLLLFSIGIKFATVFLLPVFVWVTYCQTKKKLLVWPPIWGASFGLMILAVLAAVWRADHLMAWYILYVLPFAALINKDWLYWLTGVFTFGLLLTYAPFLYYGHWDPPVALINRWLIFGSFGLGGLVAGKNLPLFFKEKYLGFGKRFDSH